MLTFDPVLVDVLITPLLVVLLGWEGFPGWLELEFPVSVPLPGFPDGLDPVPPLLSVTGFLV